jgi:hypothetical protein
MPALKATGHEARVTWLGRVADRKARLASAPLERMVLTFAGPEGEAHGGLTRPSCSRVMGLYPRGTPIRNTRQLSVLSDEDLASIAADMGLDRLDPALVGASLVVRGLEDFSHVPPGARLLADSGACLVVDMENRPCTLPARPIEAAHPGFGARFKAAAAGRRGVTAWVEAEGVLALGDRLRVFVPDQPAWAGLTTRRAARA